MGLLFWRKKKTAAAPAPAPAPVAAPSTQAPYQQRPASQWDLPAVAPQRVSTPPVSARNQAVAGIIDAVNSALRSGWGTSPLSTQEHATALTILGQAYDAGFAGARSSSTVVDELVGQVGVHMPNLANYRSETRGFLERAYTAGQTARSGAGYTPRW